MDSGKRGMLFSRQDLKRLILPLVVEQFLAILIGMMDTIMVSTVSESAVSAISLVDSINILFIQLFSAMATGGAVVAAQYLGMKDGANACRSAKQLLYVSFYIALGLGVISVVFCGPLLSLCFGGLNKSTMDYCKTYFYLSALSYPALALYNGGAALLRAMGNSKASMYTSLLMNLMNIVGNALLIYGFRLEVLGAGTATLLSRTVGAAIMLRMLLNRHQPIHLENALKPELEGRMVRRILRQGVPNGLENSMFQIGKLLVTGIISMFSESLIAANAICNSIASFVNLPGSAIGLAMVAVVGQCVGAGEKEQAKYYSKRLLQATMALMFASCCLMFALSGVLPGLFHLSAEGQRASAEVLRLFSLATAVFWTLSFTTPAALRAAGDSKFTMWVATISMWTFRVGLSYFFVYVMNMGLQGVWIAMYADWVARAVVFTLRYRSGKWLEQRVI